jgi:mono/diheme cytochrome c family protein
MGRYLTSALAVLLITLGAASSARAELLRVVKAGLGSGTITGPNISCGTDCDENYTTTAPVTLTAAVVGSESIFAGWEGDCASAGAAATCMVPMTAARSVRARFDLKTAITQITDFTPEGINTYLTNNKHVTTPAQFLAALPDEFKQNWIMMSRSESLQTGTATSPRILLPSANAQRVFTIGMTEHSSYPGAHPNAIEYMQWDATQRNFRFHEIVLAQIGEMHRIGTSMKFRFPARARGVAIDDSKCFACHSTRNVLNRGTTPGTDVVSPGLPPATVMFKNKPNWDTYDSWGGMLPFNRDRIYEGSVEAAAVRKLLNLYTWSANDVARSVIEQLHLQPSGIPTDDVITRTTTTGANDGHINFPFFDASPPVLTEPALPTSPSITTNYGFNRIAGSGTATSVGRGGRFVMLHHPTAPYDNGEGRGVDLFDFLHGLDGQINAERIGDEITTHRVATGNVLFDVRPLALAIARRCITVSGGSEIGSTQTIASTQTSTTPALSAAALAFFAARHGITDFNQLFDDTRRRSSDLTRRKADIQRLNLDRTNDPYIYNDFVTPPDFTGLLQRHGAATAGGMVTTLERIRQEVFRRPIDLGHPDSTVMGGIYVDREDDGFDGGPDNTAPVSLFRYFLEPLGVSVDKWSMGVRGRSRTYTFADVFTGIRNTIAGVVRASLISDPHPGLAPADLNGSVGECAKLIPVINTAFVLLPPADGPGAIPTYTDIQRIYNKSCIECHGGLGYPPYHTYGTSLNLAEDEEPPAGARRMERSHNLTMSRTNMPTGPVGMEDVSNSPLYQRITAGGTLALPYDSAATNETCPFGLMPCGGPPLSKVDIETIRRWIIGSRPYTEGDPHIRTIDGVSYDFQSAGEFVLLRDENLEIQARQTAVTTGGPLGPNAHTGLSSCVSVNTAVALRVGSHRVSYQPTIRPPQIERGEADTNLLVLRIDGKPIEMTSREIALPAGGRIVRTTASDGIQVEYPGGTVVVITPGWWPDHQIWYMNIDVRHARATEGVMGAIAPGNWLPRLPDGRFMGPRPTDFQQRYQDLYETFADAWRVTPATSLFEYEPGLSTNAFTIDAWPMESPRSCTAPPQPGGPQGTTPPTPIAQAEAEKLCSAITVPERRANCVQDVMATGERGFADTYVRTERIEGHVPPASPVLESPADSAELSGSVTFDWTRTFAATGGPVTYRHCIWNGDQSYDLNKCTAIAFERPPGVVYGGAIGLIGLLLFVIILFFMAFAHKRAVLALLAIVVLAAALAAMYASRTAGPTTTVARLETGKMYFWRVIAEDGQGGVVESPTRSFLVR